MRITNASISPNITPDNRAPAVKVTDQKAVKQQGLEKKDGWQNRSAASAQIIDAEYTEFYSPSLSLLQQERNSLDSTLAASPAEVDAPLSKSKSPAMEKYQLKNYDAPPPGSFIDLFA